MNNSNIQNHSQSHGVSILEHNELPFDPGLLYSTDQSLTLGQPLGPFSNLSNNFVELENTMLPDFSYESLFSFKMFLNIHYSKSTEKVIILTISAMVGHNDHMETLLFVTFRTIGDACCCLATIIVSVIKTLEYK